MNSSPHARRKVRKCGPDMLNNYDSILKFAQHSQGCKSRSSPVWRLFSSAPSSASPDHYCHLCTGLDLQNLAYNNMVVLNCNCLFFLCMCFLSHSLAIILSCCYCKGCTHNTLFTLNMNRSACFYECKNK